MSSIVQLVQHPVFGPGVSPKGKEEARIEESKSKAQEKQKAFRNGRNGRGEKRTRNRGEGHV